MSVNQQRKDKNYHEGHLVLVFYQNHYSVKFNLQNFCKGNYISKSLCRWCSNTHGSQSKLKNHMKIVLNKKFVTYHKWVQLER